jgi:hypothetical protein
MPLVAPPDERVWQRHPEVAEGNDHAAGRREPTRAGEDEGPALSRRDGGDDGEDVLELAHRGGHESDARKLVADLAAELGDGVHLPREEGVVGEVRQLQALATREAMRRGQHHRVEHVEADRLVGQILQIRGRRNADPDVGLARLHGA